MDVILTAGWPGCMLTSNQEFSILDFAKTTRQNPRTECLGLLGIYKAMGTWYDGVEV